MKDVAINSERWLNPFKLSSREVWREIDILPKGYKVSNYGRVRKKISKGVYKILNAIDNGRQYYAVTIKHKKYYIHRLVALAFVPNPNNYPEIDHINGGKSNYFKNLRWVTRSMNMANPITKQRRAVVFSKQNIPVEQIDSLGNITNRWPSIKSAALAIGVCKRTMSVAARSLKYIGAFRYRIAT